MRQIGKFVFDTPPTVEPLDLAAAKQHCRAEYSGEDALFSTFITAARQYVENDTGLALIEQTWIAYFDAWDDKGLRLRPHRVSEIIEVAVWGGSDFVAQDAANFQLLAGRPAQLITADYVVPAIPMRTRQGIRVVFKAGFGATADAVPADLVTAMKQLVAHWYENREPTAVSQNLSVVGDIKFTVGAILSNHRSLRLV